MPRIMSAGERRIPKEADVRGSHYCKLCDGSKVEGMDFIEYWEREIYERKSTSKPTAKLLFLLSSAILLCPVVLVSGELYRHLAKNVQEWVGLRTLEPSS